MALERMARDNVARGIKPCDTRALDLMACGIMTHEVAARIIMTCDIIACVGFT